MTGKATKYDESNLWKVHKWGKLIGYITALAKGLLNFQQAIKNVKLVAVYMECKGKNKLLPQKLLTYRMFFNYAN